MTWTSPNNLEVEEDERMKLKILTGKVLEYKHPSSKRKRHDPLSVSRDQFAWDLNDLDTVRQHSSPFLYEQKS